jgi:hypothetical protein
MGEFSGPATPFSSAAIADAAKAIGCDEAAIRAVIAVESHGGFLADNRPKILFERHYFHRLTNGKFDKSDPDICSAQAGGYKGGVAEWDRMDRAIKLDRQAALKSASWGAFQIMGANHQAAGFADVESFCHAMCQSEDDQLKAFVGFVKANHLDDELCRRDWAGFARGYNGPGYRQFNYDNKLQAAYVYHASVAPRAGGGGRRTLKMGDQGEDVKSLQAKLGLLADGDFGPATKAAVVKFQLSKGLQGDGIAGQQTQTALGL